MSLYPINAIGEKITPYIPIEIELLKSTETGTSLSKKFDIWAFENICMLPDSINVNYEDGTTENISEEQTLKHIYIYAFK